MSTLPRLQQGTSLCSTSSNALKIVGFWCTFQSALICSLDASSGRKPPEASLVNVHLEKRHSPKHCSYMARSAWWYSQCDPENQMQRCHTVASHDVISTQAPSKEVSDQVTATGIHKTKLTPGTWLLTSLGQTKALKHTEIVDLISDTSINGMLMAVIPGKW